MVMEKRVIICLEPGAVTGVSESGDGRTKDLFTWTRKEVGCGASNSSWGAAQWGCAGPALLRAALLSQETPSELLLHVFFPSFAL